MRIQPIQSDEEARECARLMAATEPWITLGRDSAASYQSISSPLKEVSIAVIDTVIAGCIVVNMHGVLSGYIQSVLVAPEWQGRGIGSALVAHAEQRIFRDTPNVFLLVSSFNTGARRLYERLGYRQVGELADFIIAGHSELIMRKTRGPIAAWRPDGV